MFVDQVPLFAGVSRFEEQSLVPLWTEAQNCDVVKIKPVASLLSMQEKLRILLKRRDGFWGIFSSGLQCV